MENAYVHMHVLEVRLDCFEHLDSFSMPDGLERLSIDMECLKMQKLNKLPYVVRIPEYSE